MAKKIPLDPPFSKGDAFGTRSVPLFEKEGKGEIFDYSEPQRFTQ
jgi:hypothetical protein